MLLFQLHGLQLCNATLTNVSYFTLCYWFSQKHQSLFHSSYLNLHPDNGLYWWTLIIFIRSLLLKVTLKVSLICTVTLLSTFFQLLSSSVLLSTVRYLHFYCVVYKCIIYTVGVNICIRGLHSLLLKPPL